MCWRSSASSLLALSAAALLLTGCGGPSVAEVRRAFADEGIELRAIDVDAVLARQAQQDRWGFADDPGETLFQAGRVPRTPRALLLLRRGGDVVIGVEVFRGGADAVRELRLVGAATTAPPFRRIGRIVVYWGPALGADDRRRVERALEQLR